MHELKVLASVDMIEPMVQEDEVRQIFAQRLALACVRSGIETHGRQIKIAKALHLSTKAVSKWFNAETMPRRGKMMELAKYLGVSTRFLLGENDDEFIEIKHLKNNDFYRVTVLDIEASAGLGVSVRDEFIETIRSIEYSTEEARAVFGGRPPEHIKMIAVNGDSMSGTFEPRDQIFVDVSIDHFDGDGIYIFVLDEKLFIKRLQLQHRRIAVISDNKKYETWYIDDPDNANFRVVARVLVSQSRAYKFHA
jgi:phage repressor protein C with HTH and peptisase S24 domain